MILSLHVHFNVLSKIPLLKIYISYILNYSKLKKLKKKIKKKIKRKQMLYMEIFTHTYITLQHIFNSTIHTFPLSTHI